MAFAGVLQGGWTADAEDENHATSYIWFQQTVYGIGIRLLLESELASLFEDEIQ